MSTRHPQVYHCGVAEVSQLTFDVYLNPPADCGWVTIAGNAEVGTPLFSTDLDFYYNDDNDTNSINDNNTNSNYNDNDNNDYQSRI